MCRWMCGVKKITANWWRPFIRRCWLPDLLSKVFYDLYEEELKIYHKAMRFLKEVRVNGHRWVLRIYIFAVF